MCVELTGAGVPEELGSEPGGSGSVDVEDCWFTL
jgi:hypothetical protein